MGVLDKIKNALFEVEYVEVEEPVKKEKKIKPKEKIKEKESFEKPIAKKIVLPGKKEEKVEEIKEEELKDDNFESRPIDETIKPSDHEEFKFMDDNDFQMDDRNFADEEPEILEVLDKDEQVNHSVSKVGSRREKHYKHEEVSEISEEVEDDIDNDTFEYEYSSNHADKYYSKPTSSAYSSNHDNKLYGMDRSYSVSMHEYGTYEKKEEKPYFKPSPIISPIYGILDKNYKKEDVVQKKEIRLTTNFSRSNVSVDDIRNKAYGSKGEEKKDEEVPTTTFEVDDEEDDNLLVDLSDDKGKPEVKELTMGDALEYFQDLGLEYNVDYVDASKDRVTPKREKETYDEDVEKKEINHKHDETPIEEEIKQEIEGKTTSVVEIKDESEDGDTVSLDDDDNLFDLIDSMYQEN